MQPMFGDTTNVLSGCNPQGPTIPVCLLTLPQNISIAILAFALPNHQQWSDVAGATPQRPTFYICLLVHEGNYINIIAKLAIAISRKYLPAFKKALL